MRRTTILVSPRLELSTSISSQSWLFTSHVQDSLFFKIVQAVIIERVNATVAINVSVNQNRLIRYIAKWYSYSTLIGERSIAISMSVCLSVCLSVCPQTYLWKRWTDLHKIFCADPLWLGTGGVAIRDGLPVLCVMSRVAVWRCVEG